MAFLYFTMDRIRQIDIKNIPDAFYDYYNSLSRERKDEIAETFPELIAQLTLSAEINDQSEKEYLNMPQIEIAEEEEGREIIDAWEDVSIRAWGRQSVQVPVLVCKVMPDHNQICHIHRISLLERTVKIERGDKIYGIAGKFCPQCMDFFVEEHKINALVRALSERNIPAWIQPLEETLLEWKEHKLRIDINNDATIYIPDTWIDGNVFCPIHTDEYLIEDIYRKVYKDRKVEFEACYCNKCQKIIMRNSRAQRLEEDCGEIGIPPIHFKRLKKENKKKSNSSKRIRKPSYFLQNGQLSIYTYGEDIHWIELTEEDTAVISYSRVCTQEHETEDILGLVCVDEKKDGPKDYLILMGYCDECERYYMDKDDYQLFYKKGRPELSIYDDTNSDYMITSGEIFDSENKHLQNLECDLSRSIRDIQNLPEFVSKYTTVRGGYDDGGLSFSKGRSTSYYKEIERLGNYIPKPYGYRTDLVEGDTTVTYYLGPEDIVLNHEMRVISFNSNLGRTMVNYRTLEMSIEGRDYKVKRRRTFDIENGKLFGYSEQSDEDVIFRSGITDKFLVNVLNMRKKHHQLLDIISIIQENQNTIVDLPLKQNLIVQGCAGSGKTMVMLHRLSALKYNNPDFDFENAVILTPNHNFNVHISGLAASLQLGYIERYSIEEYYYMLLMCYDASFKIQNQILDEADINQDYVDYMYSEEFLQILKEEYNQKITKLYGYYIEIGEISEKMGRTAVKAYAERDCDLIKPLLDELSTILLMIKQKKVKVQKKSTEFEQLNKKYKLLSEKILREEEQLQKLLQVQTAAIYTKLKNMKEQRLEQIQQLDEEITRSEKEYQKINNTIFVIRKPQKLEKLHDDIRKIDDKKKIYQEEVGLFSEFMNTDIINMNRKELLDFFQEIVPYVENIQENIRDIRYQEKFVDKYKKERDELPQLMRLAQQDIQTATQELVSEEIAETIDKLYVELQGITPKTIYDDIYVISSKKADECLKNKTGKNYIHTIRETTHRYDLYLQLHFSMWYFRKIVGKNPLICVDEGQDLSIKEYELLKQMNGKDTIFNVFGDTNQLLKLGRGISDWAIVEDVLEGGKIFFLNENYRNTNQITQFCNDTFSMNVLLTGIDGYKVKEILRSRFERTLAMLKINEERIAVILPRKVKKDEYIDREQLPETIKSIMGESIGNGRIAVMYADEVKGIEFDRVFVVPDGMSKNEQYIAYTRGLTELIIVKDESMKSLKESDDLNVVNKTFMQKERIDDELNNNLRFSNIKYGKVKKKRGK